MLHLIPRPLHRAALTVADAARRRWWRLRKPVLRGSRVLAFDGRGSVLLVRHSYGSGVWMLPGGGISRGENAVAAAIRELAEETGLALTDPRLLTVVEEPLHGATNRVHVVCGGVADPTALRCDGREIIAAGFFANNALPQPLSPMVASGIADWEKLAGQ